jgi:hypothetical protein
VGLSKHRYSALSRSRLCLCFILPPAYSKAVIRIVLKNTGRNPYRADVWGDEITIERVLAREGASSWRIRSALSGERSKPLSAKKETVTAMTDHFDIQVDNPMTILTQDMSRAFLGSSDAHKKYEVSDICSPRSQARTSPTDSNRALLVAIPQGDLFTKVDKRLQRAGSEDPSDRCQPRTAKRRAEGSTSSFGKVEEAARADAERTSTRGVDRRVAQRSGVGSCEGQGQGEHHVSGVVLEDIELTRRSNRNMRRRARLRKRLAPSSNSLKSASMTLQ